MTKANLKKITNVLPFDEKYILVGQGRGKNLKWNLMDANGALISETWFTSISKNGDGSIKTEVKAKHARKSIAATFINTTSFARASKVMDLVPVACLSLVDSGSIEPYKGENKFYIAKAKLYGRTVYLDKNGDIYDVGGNKLRLLFNTVDSERIFRAIKDFNHKLHYDSEQLEPDESSFTKLVEKNVAMWGFYWVNDEWSIITDHKELQIDNDVKKWTDDFIIRIATDLVPEKVRTSLVNAFGTYKEATTSDVRNWTWHLSKNDLDKLLSTLAAA